MHGADNHWHRRAFQLAHLSEELAFASERLADHARAIADAAAKLAETSEEMVVSPPTGSPLPTLDPDRVPTTDGD
jgi:hypothetical protein